jgi:hypothetical protein
LKHEGGEGEEGHERGVWCLVALAPFRGYRVSESPADKELSGADLGASYRKSENLRHDASCVIIECEGEKVPF